MPKSIESLFIEHLKFPEAGKYLKPDGRWKAWRGISNHEEFIKNYVPKLHLKENAPDHVKEAFEIVNYLNVFAYYKYELFDVAYGKALQIMEMAYKLKYTELTGKMWDLQKKPFKKLINFLYSKKQFDSHILQIYSLRDSRNRELHPVFNSFSGNTFYRRTHHVLQVINELYESVPLRIERTQLRKELELYIKENSKVGLEFIHKGKRHSIYHLLVQLIDNKGPEPIYHIVAVPPFPLGKYLNKDFNGRAPCIVPFTLLNVTLKDGVFSGFDLRTLTDVSFQKISDYTELVKLREWKSVIENLPYKRFIDNNWAGSVGSLCFEIQYNFTNK